MRTWVHLLVSLLLAAILYPTLGWKVLFILAGGVLIDIDHYLWYVHKHKKFGLIGCYNNFTIEAEKSDWKNVNGILLIFHTIEFLLIMTVMSFYNQIALILALGLFLHYMLDIIWIVTVPKRFVTNHSIIYWYIKSRIQKI